jgi:hypothetical protein
MFDAGWLVRSRVAQNQIVVDVAAAEARLDGWGVQVSKSQEGRRTTEG